MAWVRHTAGGKGSLMVRLAPIIGPSSMVAPGPVGTTISGNYDCADYAEKAGLLLDGQSALGASSQRRYGLRRYGNAVHIDSAAALWRVDAKPYPAVSAPIREIVVPLAPARRGWGISAILTNGSSRRHRFDTRSGPRS